MTQKTLDRICAGVFFAFGLVVVISVHRFTGAAKYDPLGSRFFPYAIGVCCMIVSALLAADTIWSEKYKTEAASKTFPARIGDNLRAVLFCIALLAAVYLIEKVHFLVGIFIMLTAMLLLCRVKKPLRYLIVYVCAGLAYFVFTRYFHIRL